MRIYVGTICMGWVRQELTAAMVRMATDPRHETVFGFVNDRPIPAARNRLALEFLKTDCDFLLSIDSDVWPYRNPLDLIDLDLDVAILPVPIWRPKSRPPVAICFTPLDGGGLVELGTGVREVAWGGSAFLVARRVFEGTPRPWYENAYDENGVTVATEDKYFCEKARAAGFRVWAADEHLCGHIKEVDVVDVWDAMTKRG